MADTGPEETTGKFKTREALEKEVVRLLEIGMSGKGIAEACRVSSTTVNNIKKQEFSRGRFAKLKKVILSNFWNDNLTLLSNAEISAFEEE